MENTGKIINDTEKTKLNNDDFVINKISEEPHKVSHEFIEAIASSVIEIPKEEFCNQGGRKQVYAQSFCIAIRGKMQKLLEVTFQNKFTDEDYDKIIENLEPLNNMLKTLIK